MRCSSSVLGALLLSLSCACHAIPSAEFFRAALAPPEDGGKLWVLLAAGSSGWMNYRHQADVCHAYQVFRAHQVPESQIITMMFDDIAHSFFNTIKGKVFNEANGIDVYAGVRKDYTGRQVSPKNFLAVLTGDKDKVKGVGSGRVVESGPNDKVVVFFADHGAPGMLCFPYSYHVIPHVLRASALAAAVEEMHGAGRYGSLLLYVEACESGSMFNGVLGAGLGAVAMTAASPYEPSMACGFNNTLGVYIADCFSLHLWRYEDHPPPAPAPAPVTLEAQYEALRAATNSSHLCLYGDPNLAKQPLADFIPPLPAHSPPPAPSPPSSHSPPSAVSSRLVVHETLRRRVEALKEAGGVVGEGEVGAALAAAEEELGLVGARMRGADLAFARLASLLARHHPALLQRIWSPAAGAGECHGPKVGEEECVVEAAGGIERSCGPFDDYSLQFLGVVQRACEAGLRAPAIVDAARQVCAPQEAGVKGVAGVAGVRSKCHALASEADCHAAPALHCHWCTSAAVPSKCYSAQEAAKLPPAIFHCD